MPFILNALPSTTNYPGDLSHRKMAIELLRTLHENENKIVKCVKKIIKEQQEVAKDIFTVDVYGWTFAHACVLRGSPALVKLLLSAAVDPNSRLGDPQDTTTAHCTLLHIAAYRGSSKIVKLLLSSNAKVDIVDGFGVSPLDYAKRRQHEAIYELLQDQTENSSDSIDGGATIQIKEQFSKITMAKKADRFFKAIKRLK